MEDRFHFNAVNLETSLHFISSLLTINSCCWLLFLRTIQLNSVVVITWYFKGLFLWGALELNHSLTWSKAVKERYTVKYQGIKDLCWQPSISNTGNRTTSVFCVIPSFSTHKIRLCRARLNLWNIYSD